MKTLSILAILNFLTGFAFSQAEIRLVTNSSPFQTGDDISGTVHTLPVYSPGTYALNFIVTNTSGTPKNWNIQRLRIEAPAGWLDGLNWAPFPDNEFTGACYGPDAMPSNPWTNPHTMEIDSNGILMVHLTTDQPDCAHYRYYVMEGSEKVDSVDIEICYVLNVLEQKEVAGMTAYPNPANNLLTVNTTGLGGNYEIRLTDVLGKVVYHETASGVKKNLDVSEFKNGVYLVTVLEKGVVIQTRRVVIKH